MTIYTPPVRTALSLPRYAQIMGINPIQFMSGTDKGILFPSTDCTDRWWQYPYQDPEIVSRDEIAREIQRAEQDIQAHLNYFPGPGWVEDEQHMYTRYHRRERQALRGFTPSGHYKSITLANGEYIQPGKRRVTLIEAGAAVVLSDSDLDGIKETATITVATTVTDVCEIKVFITGNDGDELYELRPTRSKSIAGGVATIVFDSWHLFKTDLLAAWPGSGGMTYIDASADASYMTTVDVYQEDADPAEQCTLYWEGAPQYITCGTCGGGGCASCNAMTQTACVGIRNPSTGSLPVIPANYAVATETFTPTVFCSGWEPDRVGVSYQSGAYELYGGCKEVPEDLARAITYMATARLRRILCNTCINVKEKEAELSEDLIYVTRNESPGDHKFVTQEVMKCPFGTRRGEVEAWRIVKNRMRRGKNRTSATLI